MSGTKTANNTQFALVSPDGTRAGADALLGPLAPGNGTEPLADPNGILWARIHPIGPPGFPTKVQASAAALTFGELVQLGPCKLATLSGFNNAPATLYYVQIYDLAAAPVIGDVPIQSMPVNALGEFSWSPALWEFVAGLWIALSTAPLSPTAAPAVMFWNAELYTP